MIALLRGINLAGRNQVSMRALPPVFEAAGCANVRTYINSGNVVFDGGGAESALRADLERRLRKAFGFEIPVVLRTTTALRRVAADNPFPKADPAKLLVAFANETVSAPAIDLARFRPEALVLHGREVYLHLPNGVGRSKLFAALQAPLAGATSRNLRTVEKLVEMAS